MYVCLYSVSMCGIVFVCKFVWLTLCKYLNVYEKRMFVIKKYAWLLFVSMHFSLQLMKMCLCFLCLQVCSFICLVGYICLSLVVIVYFISYKSLYVNQSKSFLSFFLSFWNILEESTRNYYDSFFHFLDLQNNLIIFLKTFSSKNLILQVSSLWTFHFENVAYVALRISIYLQSMIMKNVQKIVTRKISFQVFTKFCRWKHQTTSPIGDSMESKLFDELSLIEVSK